jgi:hypothetical protein
MPEDWAGRVFESGAELHEEWSKVRKGPPVVYAATYGMNKVEDDSVLDATSLSSHTGSV